MPNFVKLAATAARLIEASGRTVTLLKYNRDPADAGEPWRGPITSAEPSEAEGGAAVPATAVFVPASGGGFGSKATDREQTLVRDAQQIALVASNSIDGADLREFDALRDGADVWKIVSAEELRPGSTSLVWEVVLTK